MKRLALGFALIALVFCLLAVVTGKPTWFVAGNGFVAALLIFTAPRLS